VIDKSDQTILRYLMGEGALTPGPLSAEYRYVKNTDGTIRWLFPKHLSRPSFLAFYSTASFRARFISGLIRLAFFIRLPGLVSSGPLSLCVTGDSKVGKVLSKYRNCSYSIFTGTVGDNRKTIVELTSNEGVTTFIKIGITDSSRALVDHEVVQLNYLNGLEFAHLVVPRVVDANRNGIVELTNIKPRHALQVASINPEHIRALAEMYRCSFRTIAWHELKLSESCRTLSARISEIDFSNSQLNFDWVIALLEKLQRLLVMLDKSHKSAVVSLSHGDFTPWNMYLAGEKVYLFDWEMSQFDVPMAFDLVHFAFQSQVMIEGAGYQEVKKELDRARNIPGFQKLTDHYGMDFNASYQFYIASTLIYYLPKYAEQSELHDQARLILDVWEDALGVCLSKGGKVFD